MGLFLILIEENTMQTDKNMAKEHVEMQMDLFIMANGNIILKVVMEKSHIKMDLSLKAPL